MNTPPLGPTGEFSQGKLNKEDEGELQLGITTEKGKIIIHFGKPVAWIGLDVKTASYLAEAIRARIIALGMEELKNRRN